jgi:hypothetical protein
MNGICKMILVLALWGIAAYLMTHGFGGDGQFSTLIICSGIGTLIIFTLSGPESDHCCAESNCFEDEDGEDTEE